MQQMAEEAKKDPQMKKQMEEMQKMMSDPNAQAQMQQTMAAMNSPQMQQRMAALKDDPEIMAKMKEAQAGGMSSLMALMQDTELLEKIGRKMGNMGDMGAGPGGADAVAAPPPAAAVPPPVQHDIKDLLDAAKYGDLEATEDLIAVKKNIDQRDAEQRTPLHYAIAYNHPDIMQELLDAGADLTAVDVKGNTPLHYAAGYGRHEATEILLKAGCSGTVTNTSGHTPHQLVQMDKGNPIHADPAIVKLLEDAASRS